MAYSDFSLIKIAKQFGINFVERKLYEETPGLVPSPELASILKRHLPLARAIGTKKARSEFIIAPILAEVLFRLDCRISLFSGIDLPASPEQGLNGVCDFLIARSPQQFFLSRPVIAVVEAKNENLSTGFGQCIAEMIGARVFNEREQTFEPVMHGVVTTGTAWRFLRMADLEVVMDRVEYSIDQLDQILGIFVEILGADA